MISCFLLFLSNNTSAKVNKPLCAMKTMIILTIVIANLICISASGVPFFLLPKYYNNENSEELGIGASLNKSANPCNNFYEYACGGWIDKTAPPDYQPLWNHWHSITHKIFKRMQIILESKQIAPNYLLKAQDMYRACVHSKTSGSKSLNNLRALIIFLSGWPMVSPTWNGSEYDWAIATAKIIRAVGVYPLLKMHVFVDLRNTSQYALYVERGELGFPEIILVNPHSNKQHIKAYEVWILETIHYLFPNKMHTNLKAEVKEIVRFEIEVAKLFVYKGKSEKLSISELSEVIPIRWNNVFSELFHGTAISVNSNDTLILRNRQYLEKLNTLIAKTKIRTVANYLIWSVVRHLSRETTRYMRRLKFLIDFTIFGIKKDITITQECIGEVNMYMYSSLIPKYIKLHLHPHTIDEVSHMIQNIKSEFTNMLRNNRWLENSTKSLAMEKIASLKYIVGYPPRLNNETLLENKYKEIKMSNNHFTNIIQLKQLKIKTDLEKLREDSVSLEWPGSMFEVNAYYSILQNTVFVPIGMLELPFFDIGAPTVYNYGALGSLIGHELSHALDILGRHADRNGNIRNWWTQADVYKYEAATACFIQQYATYNVNGFETLGENIADNVGLKISYNAFANLKMREVRAGMVDLKEFSADQLFFISFSQVWCEISPNNEFINAEEHAPVWARVLGTLQNSKEFDRAFYCFKNDKDKCVLW